MRWNATVLQVRTDAHHAAPSTPCALARDDVAREAIHDSAAMTTYHVCTLGLNANVKKKGTRRHRVLPAQSEKQLDASSRRCSTYVRACRHAWTVRALVPCKLDVRRQHAQCQSEVGSFWCGHEDMTMQHPPEKPLYWFIGLSLRHEFVQPGPAIWTRTHV
jgi:hypothetical protein